PAQRAAKREAEPLQVAAVVPSGPGFVLDYLVLNTTQNNYTFWGDTTYYVSAQVNLNGTTTFEGGAVIKFRRNNAGLRLNGPWVCRTGPYRPVIFTAQDDNSVGETIAGSTGNPTGYYGNGVTLTKTGMLAQVRFAHLGVGVSYEPWGTPNNPKAVQLAHVQWIRCQVALRVVDAWCMVCGATVYVDNALVAECPTFLEGEEALVHARHLTVHQCSTLAQRQGGECSLAITNSILSAVTTLSGGGATVTTSHSASFTTSSPFQSVGAGHYYIAAAAENQIRNQGTVNIPAALLEALAQKTVFPPVVHQNIVWNQNTTLGPRLIRDNDCLPDLGYHYDALDYLLDSVILDNGTLKVEPRTAIASYATSLCVWLRGGATVEAVGAPTAPIWWTRCQAVQEQAVPIAPGTLTINSYHGGGTMPRASLRFCRFSAPANGGYHLYHDTDWAYASLQVRDCEFWGGQNSFKGARVGASSLVSLKNNLFYRSRVDAFALSGISVSAQFEAFNNLVVGVPVTWRQPIGAAWQARDNAFQECSFSAFGSVVNNSHNAYINCNGQFANSEGGDVVLASFEWGNGPFGEFYQASTELEDRGSRSVSDADLRCYTVRVNNQPDGGMVDIGFHYPGWCSGSLFWTDYNVTAQQMAEWIVGPGFTVQNATYTGATVAKGIFGNGASAGLPIDRGIIFSSGDIALAQGPNDKSLATSENHARGDADLEALVEGLSTTNAAVLEFDVLAPQATTLVFEFIFASEEYPEWIQRYNDLMAIFIDGVNIATVPDTALPVSVNTVNGGCASPEPTR
ncbi:MAG: choice-of-anchor L domain-containing protein, partial [Verrucomicrobiae bacterium]|nr:choice-of-anchor L domain-containing protein [Verrucomicrobiae bacterium]